MKSSIPAHPLALALSCALLPALAIAQSTTQRVVYHDASELDLRHSLTIRVQSDPNDVAAYSVQYEQERPVEPTAAEPSAWPSMPPTNDQAGAAPSTPDTTSSDMPSTASAPDTVSITRTPLQLDPPSISTPVNAAIDPPRLQTVTTATIAPAPAPSPASEVIVPLAITRTALIDPPQLRTQNQTTSLMSNAVHTVTTETIGPAVDATPAPITPVPIQRTVLRLDPPRLYLEPNTVVSDPVPLHTVTVAVTAPAIVASAPATPAARVAPIIVRPEAAPVTAAVAAPVVNLQSVEVDGQHLRDQQRIQDLQVTLHTTQAQVQTLTIERDQVRAQLEIAQHDLADAHAATLNQSGLTALALHDDAHAAQAFEQAAAQGSAAAQANLALLVLEGRGIGKDAERARALLEQAANQGSAVAARNLQRIYARGLDTVADAQRAQQWGQRALELEARAGGASVAAQAQ